MNEELYNILKEKGINLPSNLDSFNQMIEEDEELRNNLSSFIEKNNLDISLESKKKTLFSESPSQEDSLDTESDDYNYFENLYGAFQRGFARGSAAEEATDVLNPIADVDYNQIAEAEKDLKRLQKNKSKVLKNFEQKGFGNFRFLGSSIEQLVEVFGMMGRTVFSDKALSAGATAGTAGIATGVGAIPIAAGSTLVASSFVSEFGSTLLDTIREQTNEDGTPKFDMTDDGDLKKAFNDKDVLTIAKEKGLKRGIPVAMIDALTMRIGGKVANALAKSSKVKRAAAGVATESIGGGFGEATAQISAEGKIEDTQAIMLESLLEIVPGSPVVAYNYYQAEKMNAVDNIEIDQKINDIKERIKLEEDDNVKAKLEDIHKKLKQQKNKKNKELVDNFSEDNVQEQIEISKLNEEYKNTKEILDQSQDARTKEILEEDLKNTKEEIDQRKDKIKNNKKTKEYFNIGDKINNNEKLNKQEQDTYDNNKEEIDKVYKEVVENNDKKNDFKDEQIKNEQPGFIETNIIKPLKDFYSFMGFWNNNNDKIRSLNLDEENKSANLDRVSVIASKTYKDFQKLINNVKSVVDPETLNNINDRLVAFVTQSEIDGKLQTKTEVIKFLNNLKTKDGSSIESSKIIDSVTNMRIQIDNLSNMILENQNYQKAYEQKALEEGKDFVNPLDVIKQNLGKYLTRGYRAFGEKNFDFNKTREETRRKAYDKFFNIEYQKLKKENPRLSKERLGQKMIANGLDARAQNKANYFIDQLEAFFNKDYKNIYQNLNDGISFEKLDVTINPAITEFRSKLLKDKDINVLKERKEVDELIRTFLGEYKDVGAKFVNTVDKLSKLNYEQVFHEDVLKRYEGELVFQEEQPNTTLYESDNPANPLNGKYVDTDLYEALTRTENYDGLYYKILGLMRKSKTVWNIPNIRKNITGNWMAMIQNGYYFRENGLINNATQLLKSSMDTFRKNGEITGHMKELFERGSKYGLTNQSVGLGTILDDGAVLMDVINDTESKSVNYYDKGSKFVKKNIDNRFQELYGRIDDFSKLLALDVESNITARQEYGIDYKDLSDKQKSIVDNIASEKVKNTFPTWSRVPTWYKSGFKESGKKIFGVDLNVIPNAFTKKGFFGDFVPFKLEALRTYVNSIKEISNTAQKIADINKEIKKETDSDKLNILKERKKAYAGEYGRRLNGALMVAGSQATLKAAIPAFVISRLVEGTEEEKENNLKKAQASYNAMRKFYPDWMDGHTLLGDYDNMSYNKEKDRYEINTFDYSLENPYSLVLDPVFNILKGEAKNLNEALGEITDVAEPNMFIKTLTEAYSGRDVYGNKIDGFTDKSWYLLSNSIVPPNLKKVMNDYFFNETKTNQSLGKSAREFLIIRDYKFSPDSQFSFELRDFAEDKSKSKNDLKRFRDLYTSSVTFSQINDSNFVNKIREVINKSRLSKEEKNYILTGGGLSLINYEEE